MSSKTIARIDYCGHTRIPKGSRIKVTEGTYREQAGTACNPTHNIKSPLPKGLIGIMFDYGGTGTLPEQANVRVAEVEIIK